MSQPDENPDEKQLYHYWAFISYSHQDNLPVRGDGSGDHLQWANWLHEQLETFRIPALHSLALRERRSAPLPQARPQRPYPHPHRGRRAQPSPHPKPGRTARDDCFCPVLVHPLRLDGEVDTTRLLPEEPIGADVRVKDTEPPREMRATKRDQRDKRRAEEDLRRVRRTDTLFPANAKLVTQTPKFPKISRSNWVRFRAQADSNI